MPGSKGTGGLGDITPKYSNPLETYWDQQRMGVGLGKRKWIVAPEWKPCSVTVPDGPGADVANKMIEAMQQFFECHVLPRNWQLLADFMKKLEQQVFNIKNPNWHEAPITGTPLDLRNDDPASIASALTPTVITSFRVPDRHVGTVLGFGQGVCTFNDWNRVLWTIQVNKRPVVGYQNFRLSIGEYENPTILPKPILLKGRDLFEVTGVLSAAGAAADTWARSPAFIFPVREVTQDGSWKDFLTSK